jgi:Asp-tRNA(Asn)/Glu-tRNA(Gln) amidotransferase A subunit family amidase
MNTDLTYSDATKLAELIRNREVTSVQVVHAHLDRIDAINPKINAIDGCSQISHPCGSGLGRLQSLRTTSCRDNVTPSGEEFDGCVLRVNDGDAVNHVRIANGFEMHAGQRFGGRPRVRGRRQ